MGEVRGASGAGQRSVRVAAPLPGERATATAEPREGVQDLYRVPGQAERTWDVAVASPDPHAMPYAEMTADGSSDEGDVLIDVLLDNGTVVAVAWACVDEVPFTVGGGLTDDDADFALRDLHAHVHERPVPDLRGRLAAIVQRGLLSAAEPGDGAYPDGDCYLHVTDDLRLGAFGHPWEQTLTVRGSRLLAAVEEELTALLGEPIGRRDRGRTPRAVGGPTSRGVARRGRRPGGRRPPPPATG
ncbi:DUF2716 domain-containing protein [Streptomyces virginiae]|uniref:DUF2716 domain-containing protein n=1 Tax=Streptomyces virginiae TaxID=1961 RepID=UPI00369DDC33